MSIQDDEIKQKPSITQTIDSLREGGKEGVLPEAGVFYGLSSLVPADLKALTPVWQALDGTYKHKILRALAEASETNFDLDYRAIGTLSLSDSDARVRQAAIETLWIDDTIAGMNQMIALAENDPSTEVRAAALIALGRYILEGELDHIPENATQKAQEVAIRILKDEFQDVEVRRRALEAISNSSHEIVPKAIKQAYHGADRRMQVSAIYAMGRSCDEQWEETVLEELESDVAEMRYEAVRASGEMEIMEAVPRLTRLVVDEDREVQAAAIWSLGEIGGREAMRVLEALVEVAEENDDDDLLDAVEEALSNASLFSGDLFSLDDLEDA